MKKFGALVLTAAALLAVPFLSHAEPEETEDAPRALTADEMKTWEENFKKQKTKIKELEGSEWDVTLTSFDAKNKKTEEKDSLVFKNGTVSLASFTKKGFPAVGYTVTPKEDGEGAIWENYQEAKIGTLSMRGDWNGEVMNGAVREVTDNGKKSQNYTFSSKKVLSAPVEDSSQADTRSKSGVTQPTGKSSLVSLEKVTP